LATWADGRNAIAVKGRVVATTGADETATNSGLARLAINTGEYFRPGVLSVIKAGSGTGTVMSSPVGISCGTSCAMSLATGESITLTAAPASGSVFLGWHASAPLGTQASCAGTGTCEITGGGRDVEVTAVFGETLVTVAQVGSGTGTVTSSPTDISCGTSCATHVALGDSLTLAADPAPNSSFLGWASECTGTEPCGVCSGTGSCTVKGSGFDITVWAVFVATLPDTRIETASISSKSGTAAFEFDATGTGTASGFWCELRRAKTRKTTGLRDCGSPKTYNHLKPGRYTFEVRAIGPGGTDPTPAKTSFRIKR
jgi:hypothetical protein